MTRPILIVLHQEHSSPGRVGLSLQARGHALDIRRPRFGDPLPERLDGHGGVVVFGGPMSANDSEPYLREEIALVERCLAQEARFLGICLGAQMLGKALGGRVHRHPEGRVEIGYHPIAATETGRALMDWPSHVYQWHSEGFEAPGAEVLARSEDFPVQAVRCGRAFGIQFHPDVTDAMLYRWCVRGAHRFGLPGAQGRQEQLRHRFVHDPAKRRFLADLISLWLAEAQADAL